MAESTADAKRLVRTSAPIVLMATVARLFAQSPPASPERPWHSTEERQIVNEGRRYLSPPLRIAPDRIYSLAELIDLAEAYNPETRAASQSAVAQANELGIA